MTWLAFFFAFEVGLSCNNYLMWNYEQDKYDYMERANQPYTQLSVDAIILDRLHIGGSVRTFMFPPDITNLEYSWEPTSEEFDFWAYYQWSIFQAGMWHQCCHPVLCYRLWYDRDINPLWEGAVTRVYIRVTVKLGA